MNAWIAEICATLFTTLGLTQTADTGQVWSSGGGAIGTLPGSANTSAGYVIGRFNDTLQATAPVFLRLDFGAGSPTTNPQMWITVGTGSNGSGTINGTVMTKVACGSSSPWPTSTTTSYSSYFVYNTTYGVLGIGYKMGAINASFPGVTGLGFYLFRGSTSTGASNSDAICLFTQVTANGGAYTSAGSVGLQCISYSKTTVYPTTLLWGALCFCPPLLGYNGFLSTDAPTIWPAFYLAPQPTITGVFGVVNCSDVNVGTSFSAAILGSTTLTFLNIGGFGNAAIGISSGGPSSLIGATVTNVGSSLSASTAYGLAMLWQ